MLYQLSYASRAYSHIPTAELNRAFERITAQHEPPIYRGKRVKYYYVTQAGVRPPTFALFVNSPAGVHFSYMRYIENHLREAFDFYGTPLRIRPRQRRAEQTAEERTEGARKTARNRAGRKKT